MGRVVPGIPWTLRIGFTVETKVIRAFQLQSFAETCGTASQSCLCTTGRAGDPAEERMPADTNPERLSRIQRVLLGSWDSSRREYRRHLLGFVVRQASEEGHFGDT